jgi:hypothetical protein
MLKMAWEAAQRVEREPEHYAVHGYYHQLRGRGPVR